MVFGIDVYCMLNYDGSLFKPTSIICRPSPSSFLFIIIHFISSSSHNAFAFAHTTMMHGLLFFDGTHRRRRRRRCASVLYTPPLLLRPHNSKRSMQEYAAEWCPPFPSLQSLIHRQLIKKQSKATQLNSIHTPLPLLLSSKTNKQHRIICVVFVSCTFHHSTAQHSTGWLTWLVMNWIALETVQVVGKWYHPVVRLVGGSLFNLFLCHPIHPVWWLKPKLFLAVLILLLMLLLLLLLLFLFLSIVGLNRSDHRIIH